MGPGCESAWKAFHEHFLAPRSAVPMGGPCFLVDREPTSRAEAVAALLADPISTTTKKVKGPPATDNFQVAPFEFDGVTWHSVEQCYQAYKFLDQADRERIRHMAPHAGESDSSHGMRVWRAGGSGRGTLRSDWNAVKVEIMLRACRAKLAAHETLRDELLGTGEAQIVGARSTQWASKSGSHGWSEWNGNIQMLLREELKQAASGEAPTDVLRGLAHTFQDYMQAEGGAQHPLPGDK